jgi:ABC-type multidrug transport system ATPase subunit
MWKNISLVAPYQELPLEFTLNELIDLQNRLSPVSSVSCEYSYLLAYFGLEQAINKPIRDFSTGMKQKARFVLSFGSRKPIWLLDEPGSNLDSDSCQILHSYLLKAAENKLIILATNDPSEISLGKPLFQL